MMKTLELKKQNVLHICKMCQMCQNTCKKEILAGDLVYCRKYKKIKTQSPPAKSRR